MTTIEITWIDGTKSKIGRSKKLTKTAVTNIIKELMTDKRVVEITIK